MVQRRAAIFVNYRSTTSVTTLVGELGWNTLEHCRQTSRLTAMYKSVNSLNSVSPDQLHQHSRLNNNNNNNRISIAPYGRNFRGAAPRSSRWMETVFPLSSFSAALMSINTPSFLEPFATGINCLSPSVLPHHQKLSNEPWTHCQ